MNKTILFPFDIKEDNRTGYEYTMKLAAAQQASILLFTTIEQESSDQEIDEVYLHLLELNGHYQTAIKEWGNQSTIKTERSILGGTWALNLEKVLEERQPYCVVLQNHSNHHQQLKKELLAKDSLTTIFV